MRYYSTSKEIEAPLKREKMGRQFRQVRQPAVCGPNGFTIKEFGIVSHFGFPIVTELVARLYSTDAGRSAFNPFVCRAMAQTGGIQNCFIFCFADWFSKTSSLWRSLSTIINTAATLAGGPERAHRWPVRLDMPNTAPAISWVSPNRLSAYLYSETFIF